MIVPRGAGRSFCAGYDFSGGFEHWPHLDTEGKWDPGKDFAGATAPRSHPAGVWIYRLGLTRVKWHGLTGKPLSGSEAEEAGLINEAVPFEALETRVAEVAGQLASIPGSQLAAMKLIINQAYENMGLASTQTLGPILDGLMRNTPDALRFIEKAGADGVSSAAAERDAAFADYSQAPPGERPDPSHVIEP